MIGSILVLKSLRSYVVAPAKTPEQPPPILKMAISQLLKLSMLACLGAQTVLGSVRLLPQFTTGNADLALLAPGVRLILPVVA